MSKRWLLLGVAVVAVAIAVMPIMARAQGEAGTITKTGSLFADTGGAVNSWVVEIPAGEQVEFTLKQTNFPCLPGPPPMLSKSPYLGDFGLKVSQWGRTNYSTEVGTAGCLQKLYYTWPDGGMATVEVYNYQDGFSADYELTMEGVIVPAEEAMVETAETAETAEVVEPAAEPATGRAE